MDNGINGLVSAIFLVSAWVDFDALSSFPSLKVDGEQQPTKDLAALGHVFSLPGAVVGVVIAGLVRRHLGKSGVVVNFSLGFCGVLVGFSIVQIMICNMFIWCGSCLSCNYPIKLKRSLRRRKAQARQIEHLAAF